MRKHFSGTCCKQDGAELRGVQVTADSEALCDFARNGIEVKLSNTDLAIYSIIDSDSDSELMIEMLGEQFKRYREIVLHGASILEAD
jgi:hypothetical protein